MDSSRPQQEEVNAVWKQVWGTQLSPDMRSAFSNRLFIEGYKVIRKWIPTDARSILDVGTGSGTYALALARDFPSASIAATDIIEESFDNIKKLSAALGTKNLSVAREDGQALSYPDNSFDVVFSDVVIQHVPDDQQMVSEMARVLKPGGILIVSSVNALSLHAFVRFIQRLFGKPYSYGVERLYSRSLLKIRAENAGLSVLAVKGFYPAYGMYRLKRYWGGFALIGRALNRMTRFLDRSTGNRVSDYFGFELVCIAKKHYSARYEKDFRNS